MCHTDNVAVDPRGQWIVSTSQWVGGELGDSHTLKIWSLRSKKQHALRMHTKVPAPHGESCVVAVQFNAAGSMFVTGAQDSTFKLWSCERQRDSR